MPLKIVLLFAIVIAILAHQNVEVEEHDEVALLQGQVEAKRNKQPVIATSETNDGYQIADHMKCASEGSVAVDSDLSDSMSPTLSEEPLPAQLGAFQMKSDDPAGASALRAVLVVMTILLFFDGIRRWMVMTDCLQTREKEQKNDPTVKCGWVEMVNAASKGDVHSFKKALNHTSSLERADTWGCTPLHFAALGGSATITTELLKREVEVDSLDAGDETPLHIAARSGHTSVCELLLGANAQMDIVNKQGITPLVVAGHANQEPVCRFLADAGAGVAGLKDEELPLLVVSQMVRKMLTA